MPEFELFKPVLTVAELNEFLRAAFPDIEVPMVVEDVEPGRVAMRLHQGTTVLRPGGTVSGPALMALADAAMFMAVIAHIGPRVMAVTSNLSISFLSKPESTDLLAETRLAKLGRRHAVGEVRIAAEGDAAPVALAIVTYALPSKD